MDLLLNATPFPTLLGKTVLAMKSNWFVIIESMHTVYSYEVKANTGPNTVIHLS